MKLQCSGPPPLENCTVSCQEPHPLVAFVKSCDALLAVQFVGAWVYGAQTQVCPCCLLPSAQSIASRNSLCVKFRVKAPTPHCGVSLHVYENLDAVIPTGVPLHFHHHL